MWSHPIDALWSDQGKNKERRIRRLLRVCVASLRHNYHYNSRPTRDSLLAAGRFYLIERHFKLGSTFKPFLAVGHGMTAQRMWRIHWDITTTAAVLRFRPACRQKYLQYPRRLHRGAVLGFHGCAPSTADARPQATVVQ